MSDIDTGFEAYKKIMESFDEPELDDSVVEEESTEVEEPEATAELDDETPEEDVVEEEAEVEDELDTDEETEDEIEESEEANTEESDDDSEDEDVYDIGGVEITKSRLDKLIKLEEESKGESFRLSDYTKKTTKLKEKEKTLDKELQEVRANNEFAKQIISSKMLTDEEIAKVGEDYGFEEYQKVLQEQKQLKDDLSKIEESSKTARTESKESKLAEIQRVYDAFPAWFNVTDKGANYTEEFATAQTEMTNHMLEIGATDKELEKVNSLALFKLVQDSIELKKLKTNKEKVKKKVKKAVVVGKGQPKVTSSAKQRLAKAQKAYDSNPSKENYIKLQKLQK